MMLFFIISFISWLVVTFQVRSLLKRTKPKVDKLDIEFLKIGSFFPIANIFVAIIILIIVIFENIKSPTAVIFSKIKGPEIINKISVFLYGKND